MRDVDLDQIWPFPQRRFNTTQPYLIAQTDNSARAVYDLSVDADAEAFSSALDEHTSNLAGEGPGVLRAGRETVALAPKRGVVAPPALSAAALRGPQDAAYAYDRRPPPLPSHASHTAPATDLLQAAPPKTPDDPAPEVAGTATPPLNVAPRMPDAAPTEDLKTRPARSAVANAPNDPALARTRRDWTPLVWGGLGFMAGMLAWHVVGFWTFMSDVVLNANDTRAVTRGGPVAARARPQMMPKVAVKEPAATDIASTAPVAAQKLGASLSGTAGTGPAPSAETVCMTLALNRAAGTTAPAACAEEAVAGLRDSGFNRRADRLALRPRLQDPVAWTGGTAVDTTLVEPAPAAETEAAAEPVMDFGTLQPADLKLDMD